MPMSKSYNTYPELLNPEFRKRVNGLLAGFERHFYSEITHAADMLAPEKFSIEFYKRSTIETILRIALKRAVDPLIANYWATRDSVLCKEWGLYGAEEGRHDRMFATDLHTIGMTDEEIYATKPTFATELLNGYFYYCMQTEGPLAAMVSGFYLEFVAGKTQPEWLDRIEKHLGEEKSKGQRAHLKLDEVDEHVDMVWNMINRQIKTKEDEERFVEHLIKINALFVAYFVELANNLLKKKTKAEAWAVAPIAAVAVADETRTAAPANHS